MQQGDCNAPSTFQRLMNSVFHDYIGVFVHVYLDDIFVFSDTIEEHQKHLELVFAKLQEQSLYLCADKCELYAEKVECLGHMIDEHGLHADSDKMAHIQEWKTPRNYHEVQHFLGLVQYLAHFLPDISTYTSPLSAMTQNGQAFLWRPLHDHCFQMIKNICCRMPVLKPIDPGSPELIWVICDASVFGIGAMYCQGPEWQTCRPAGFLSKKFSDTQRNYRTFEHETIAILEALLKWEDKLIGRRIHVVTDHKALEFFQTQH
jgi:RNase H-like domain found in reverse transcriptase/Reverse transcriptase (RNA-dependent DNA polymerase)